MSTQRQKSAARRNISSARAAQSHGTQRRSVRGNELSTAEKNRMSRERFAFPKERKEPLNDASHVRNAVARFDQVEGVTDRERDAAWRRIRAAAREFGVEIKERGWRQLMQSGRAGTR
ncbi:MAG: DUF6582 domain-containing protein [Candidatus Dormibacteria bacterium]